MARAADMGSNTHTRPTTGAARARLQRSLQSGIDIADLPIVEGCGLPNERMLFGTDAAGLLFQNTSDVTAILAMSGALALGALAEAERRGLRVPEDLSICCIDDLPEFADYQPPVTVVAQPVNEKGRAAAQILFDDKVQHLTLPVNLIVRGSTAAPRLAQPLSPCRRFLAKRAARPNEKDSEMTHPTLLLWRNRAIPTRSALALQLARPRLAAGLCRLLQRRHAHARIPHAQ